MIDAQTGKFSSASEFSKTRASAHRAVLHISTAYALGGLSETNHRTIYAIEKKEKNYICSLIEVCPKKGKFTRGTQGILCITCLGGE